MKRIIPGVLILGIVSMVSCVQEGQQAGFDQSGLNIPRNQSDIFEFITNVEEAKDTMQQRGPITVSRGGDSIEVTGYMHGSQPIMVYARYPDKQEWYYLKESKLVFLKEMISASTGSSTIVENHFFYNDSTLLGNRTRNAPSLDSLMKISFSAISEQAGDYRFDPKKANESAINFIYGR